MERHAEKKFVAEGSMMAEYAMLSHFTMAPRC